MTHQYIAFTLDLLLLLLLVLFWKPLALVLIYIELLLRMTWLTTYSMVHAMWDLYPPTLINNLLVTPYYFVMSRFMDVTITQNLAEKNQRQKLLRELWECFTCLWSLSLLMRFFSGPPSTVELKKHNRLAKFSVIYRICRHII